MGLEEQILEMKKQEGRKEEQVEQQTQFVRNLLLSTDFSKERIASLASVTIASVDKIQQKISAVK